MKAEELAVLCSLHRVNGIGNRTLTKINEQYSSFQAFYNASVASLKNFGLPQKTIELLQIYKKQNDIDDALRLCHEQEIHIKTILDIEYPELLRNIYNPPFVLYYKGDFTLTEQFSIAIVGSRAATVYGKNQTYKIACDLATNQTVVVSGMARGIDTQAHRGALAVNGKTIAVLGSGIDVIYPRENYKLSQEIVEKGLLLSEFPPGTRPEPGNFPMRNRTISGLANGIAVMEAKKKSGALITADFALEQGRDVFALPGPVNSANSEGTNYLIKQGASLITSAQDILEEYGRGIVESEQSELQTAALDPQQSMVIECLRSAPMNIDTLLRITGIKRGTLSSVLLQLEIQGLIQATAGNNYCLL